MSSVAGTAIPELSPEAISGPWRARPLVVEEVSAREFDQEQLQRLAVCRRQRAWQRRRSAGRFAFLVFLAVLAAWLGALVGQKAFHTEARFIEEHAALEGGVVRYGTPEIPGHPGAQTFERRDLLRLFVALDAVD